MLFSSKLFPGGLPEEFSFIVTYKARRLPSDKWHIIKLTDSQNRPQFLITVDGKNKTLEFSIVNYEGRLQTLKFKSPPVSRKNDILLLLEDKPTAFQEQKKTGTRPCKIRIKISLHLIFPDLASKQFVIMFLVNSSKLRK